MSETHATVLAPSEDKLLTFALLAGRWNCHEKVAARRAKALGLPLVRWNRRAVCVRLSDVLRAEREATA
jgi:hypothetical protein